MIICLIGLLNTFLYAAENNSMESDQQISEFSLAGYGEGGKKTWEIFGKTADIFSETVKLDNVEGNLYGEKEDVNLTAERGDFNKQDGKVKLEDNVVITTSSGARLTTDYLEWDREAQVVSTEDNVNIERGNTLAAAVGAKGMPDLNKVSLERNVRLDIKPDEASGQEEKIVITCDGPLEIEYEKNIASFYNNVKVERADSVIYSDRMDIFFAESNDKSEKEEGFMGNKVDKIIARGNVKITRGKNVSYSEEAIYTASDKKIILTGRPKLTIISTGELKDASFGD